MIWRRSSSSFGSPSTSASAFSAAARAFSFSPAGRSASPRLSHAFADLGCASTLSCRIATAERGSPASIEA
jgi:hypothetical protein